MQTCKAALSCAVCILYSMFASVSNDLLMSIYFICIQTHKSSIISVWMRKTLQCWLIPPIESTCFDGVLSSHETDNDCGGEFCSPCNISEVSE